jgi:hypothetical protein
MSMSEISCSCGVKAASNVGASGITGIVGFPISKSRAGKIMMIFIWPLFEKLKTPGI